ncbi:MAG: hypothetical protein J5814_09175 [Bacteroidaceae bacterium]|nr:hypothetical protein [Bacteroidaceae bacterium]
MSNLAQRVEQPLAKRKKKKRGKNKLNFREAMPAGGQLGRMCQMGISAPRKEALPVRKEAFRGGNFKKIMFLKEYFQEKWLYEKK